MVDNSAYLDDITPLQADAGSNSLAVLVGMAEDAARARAEVARLEAELTRAKERLSDLVERRLPEAMDEIGQAEFKTTTGLKVTITEQIRASIPKPRQREAVDWLKRNGHGGLVKRVISLTFGKGEDKLAEEAKKKVLRYEPDDKATVNPQTLGAFVREQLAEGKQIPLDLFGVFRQRVAKIDKE